MQEKSQYTILKMKSSLKLTWNAFKGFVDGFLLPFIQVFALRAPHQRRFPEPPSETLPSLSCSTPTSAFFHNTCYYLRLYSLLFLLILYFILVFCPSPLSRIGVRWAQQRFYIFYSLLYFCCPKHIIYIQSIFVKWMEKERRKKWIWTREPQMKHIINYNSYRLSMPIILNMERITVPLCI